MKYLKITVYTLLLFLLYLILPVYLCRKASFHPILTVIIFYILAILFASYLYSRYSRKKNYIQYQAQNLQEKINILNEENSRENKSVLALQAKISRYNSLKKIIEEINENLGTDSVSESLTEISFSVISNNQGVCNLYLVDSLTQKLTLFKTRKEDKKLIIKAKEGDIFDLWVLRHNTPLLIEDIKKDFRFDLERLRGEELRPVSSLVSAPFISEFKFLGILRLDNSQTNFFSQDDLRFLMTISDIGAVALENSELFQKTQELAIHDGLTALFTKSYFLERLREELKRSARLDSVFSLLMLDIDYFKDYNDKFGHTAGDIVLKKLSQTITEFLKDYNAILSRFGGEEFCVIIPGLNREDALGLASRLRERIEKERMVLRRQETSVTVSIGLASFPRDGVSEDQLISKSDKAMYEAKQKGRNRVCCT
ncbi:MAG: sensor domain-containing diguanylate cyclase [Candidatus Omnitrophica bacterium]|nr:sensor domain-containing diguanylate cyclase [Candidatus Omnitrophota bacterium]